MQWLLQLSPSFDLALVSIMWYWTAWSILGKNVSLHKKNYIIISFAINTNYMKEGRKLKGRDRPPLQSARETYEFHSVAWHLCHRNSLALKSFYGASFFWIGISQKLVFVQSILQFPHDAPPNPVLRQVKWWVLVLFIWMNLFQG